MFKADKDASKVNLGIGAYRTNEGKPFVFPIVKKVELEIANDMSLDKEYAPIEGIAEFVHGAKMAAWGWDHPDVKSGRICTLQTISGTGALRTIADFFIKFRPAPIYVSKPTWGNHVPLF